MSKFRQHDRLPELHSLCYAIYGGEETPFGKVLSEWRKPTFIYSLLWYVSESFYAQVAEGIVATMLNINSVAWVLQIAWHCL